MNAKQIKIVVLCQKYLCPRILNSLKLDELAESLDLECWDVSVLAETSFENEQDKLIRPWAKTIKDYHELQHEASRLPSDAIAVLYTSMSYSTFMIHSCISKYVACGVRPVDNSTYWGHCETNRSVLHVKKTETLPAVENTSRLSFFVSKIRRILYKSDWMQLLIKYCQYKGDHRFVQFRNGLYRQKIERSYKKIYRVGMDNLVNYKTSSVHFDTILRLENEKNLRIIDKPYIVFLDSNYPMHQDWRERVPEFDWAALQKPYFDSLNCFFDRIESEYGCEVVVGLHPNTQYETSPYKHRTCIKYKSVELVKDAIAVMCHATGSVTFVSYYNKPFCFLTNDALKTGNFPRCLYPVTVYMANDLGIKLVDTDHVDSVKGIFTQLDPELRTRFLDAYFGDYKTKKLYAEQLKDAFIDIYNRIKH